MDNIFRPSHALPVVEDRESVFHELIGSQITKQLEKLTAEVWAQFPCTATPEENEAFRQACQEKLYRTYPQGRVIQTFEIIATRTGDEK